VIYPTSNNKKDDMTGDLWADGKGPEGGALAFEKSREKVLGDLKEVIAYLVREGLLEQQQTVPPPRRKGQTNPNQAPLDLPGLKALLAKDIRTLGVGERNRVINFLRDITAEQLGEHFKQMSPQEVQQMEYVVNSSVGDNKIGPFFNKIEIAHGISHLANLQKQRQPQQGQQQTQPPGQKKVSTQKMALPKQELSQGFQGKVQQYFNQIKQAPGLNPQQREKLIAQLGRIQFAPEGNEQSKLRQIQDFVRSNLGKERVDIGAQPQQQQQASSWAPKPGQQHQQKSGGGVLGKVKGMFGLNEDFRTLMLEDL